MKIKTVFFIGISVKFRVRMILEKIILKKIIFVMMVIKFSTFYKKRTKIINFEPIFKIQKPSLFYFSRSNEKNRFKFQSIYFEL